MTKGDRSAHRRDAEGDGGRSDMDAQTITVPAANGMDHRPSAQALASEATALNVADHRVAGREEAGVRGEAGGGQDHEVEGDRPLAQSAVSTSASVPAAAATAMGPTEDGRADAEARGGEHEKVSADDASEPPVRGTFDYSFSRRIACLSEPAGVAARGYRALQTHLLAGHVRDGRRGLAVCAPTPACGCTSVAVNLAVAFAQAGINTLLIDANLHRPAVQDFIRPEQPARGLVQMLSVGAEQRSDEIRREVRPNLSVLYAGGASPRAHDLIASRLFKQIIDDCMRAYEFTIVDTPATDGSSDARQIAMGVRYGLIVARRDMTLLTDVHRTVAELSSDRVRLVGSFLAAF